MKHASAPNLRAPKAVVRGGVRSGADAVQAAVSMAVSMARQNAFERGQDPMELVPYQSRAVAEVEMLKVAQQLNNSGKRADDMLHQGRMELYQQMQMQAHFGRQTRDAQNGIMNGIIGFLANMQKKESNAMATLMGQQAQQAMVHAQQAEKMAEQMANTVKDLSKTHAKTASDMANKLSNVASQSLDTANKALALVANRNGPQRAAPPPQKPATQPTRVTRPLEAFTRVREQVVTDVSAGGGGGGIAIAAVAALALLALGAR